MKSYRLILSAAMLSGCAVTSIGPLVVPLQYRPAEETPVEYPTIVGCAGITAIEVTDGRGKTITGSRILEKQRDQKADVSLSGDIGQWIRHGTMADLKLAGISVGAKERGVLQLTINSISTEEMVYKRADYAATITMSGELQGKTSIWKGQSSGGASNFGYAGSIVDYQEVLNFALDRWVQDLLTDRDFRKAACE